MSCITLLSDLGLQDASVASVKGVLMQHNPGVAVVDISHQVEPFHVQQAAYLLAAAFKNFPKGSFHIVLVDVFAGRQPRLLLCERNGCWLLAPDNGILSLAFETDFEHVWEAYTPPGKSSFYDWVHEAGKIVNKVITSGVASLSLGTATLHAAPVHWQPKVSGNTVECHVIHIDRFDNVILNITEQLFNELRGDRPFRITFMRDEVITEISSHYDHVREGEKLCRFNATGYLEIAINRDKAASLLGLSLRRDQHLIYNTIKITFG